MIMTSLMHSKPWCDLFGMISYQRWWRNLYYSGGPWVSAGVRQNGHLLPLVIGIRTKTSRKPEVNGLIPILTELILAMPVCFWVWHTLHKSQLHCFGVMPWWAAYGSLMPAHLPAEVGCETWERIVLLLAFIA